LLTASIDTGSSNPMNAAEVAIDDAPASNVVREMDVLVPTDAVAGKDDAATSTTRVNLNIAITLTCLVAAGLLAMQVLPSSLSKIADDKQLETSRLCSSDVVESLKHELFS